MWHMDDDFWAMHAFWWIFWFIFFIIIFFVGVWYIRNKHTTKETPLDILKRRYAAGEIDTEEYHLRKRELEKGN